MSTRRARVVVLVAIAMTSCGVPTGDDTFSEIPPGEVQFGLNATSTTTSTTSTTTTTTPAVPETTVLASTTTIRFEPVQIYYLARGRLQPVTVDLSPDPSPEQVADVLEDGPPPDIALGTLIEDGLIVSAIVERGGLTVDLDPGIFDRIASTQQTEAIAQIVLTLLGSQRGVGLVSFTLGGETIAVRTGDGQLSDPGEPLAIDDYVNLLGTPRTTSADTSVPSSLAQ